MEQMPSILALLGGRRGRGRGGRAGPARPTQGLVIWEPAPIRAEAAPLPTVAPAAPLVAELAIPI